MTRLPGWYAAKGLGSCLAHSHACCALGSLPLHSHRPATVQNEGFNAGRLSQLSWLLASIRDGAFC